MNISELYASAWDNAIKETAEFVNEAAVSPTRYTYRDWVVLEPFAIVNQIEFDEDGYIVSVPDRI